MKISNLRRLHTHPSPRGFRAIATFSLEITPDVKIFDLQLISSEDGRLNVYPPKSGNGSLMAAIAPLARQQIAKMVLEEIDSEQHSGTSAII